MHSPIDKHSVRPSISPSAPSPSWNILAAIVDSSDDAIISKNLRGIITSWNHSAQRIFGYEASEIIGKSVLLLIPPELHPDEARILAKITAGERIEHFQTVRVRKNGERIDVSLTVSPVKDEQGMIMGAAKIVRDVTEQKRLEAALQTTERLASVGRLAATVAHEINNPLEAVTNFVYLAKQQTGLPNKARQYLDSADRALERVAHIAQQTLGFYRENSRPTSFRVAEIFEDILAIYERKIKYKNLAVERRFKPALHAVGYEGEVKQIVSNLITNAIDASKQGGKIYLAARAARDLATDLSGLRITVADNGGGISAADKLSLFAPFFTTKKTTGTGLGLWITKDLLRQRGGQIRFRSSISGRHGTVMSIFIPEPKENSENRAS